jgi:phage portal protein BeeE
MIQWTLIPGETGHLYSPVGLRPLDELTGAPPIGSVTVALDVRASDGSWQPTDLSEVRTSSGVITYPGLERHVDPTGLAPRRYRVRLAADFYIPNYQSTSDGIEFDAYPYNDQSPPTRIVRIPSDTLLLPAPNYPFSSYLIVLHGLVVDAAGNPVQDALVTQGAKERALTTARGAFALPLRWVAPDASVEIDASDQRTGRTGSIQVQLPAALYSNQTITIR